MARSIYCFGMKWGATPRERQIRAATLAQRLGSQSPNLEHCLRPSQAPGIQSPRSPTLCPRATVLRTDPWSKDHIAYQVIKLH